MPPTSEDWDGFYSAVEAVATANVQAPLKCPLDFKFTMDAASNNVSTRKPTASTWRLSSSITRVPRSATAPSSALSPSSNDCSTTICTVRFEHNHTHEIDYPINNLSNEDCSSIHA